MTTLALPFAAISADREAINRWLDRMLEPGTIANPALSAARYAVMGAGQRLRPLVSLRVARMLGTDETTAMRAAAAVELIHCASLIVDDLPSMDNSAERRGRPACHVAFGEPVALLAAFSLVALASKLPLEGATRDQLALVSAFQQRLMSILSWDSLVGGQVLDLQMQGETRRAESEHISDLKTVPLFQVAAHAGAVLVPLRAAESVALDEFGREFGLAYQCADDFMDSETDDTAAVYRHLSKAREALAPFGVRAAAMEDMLDYLDVKTIEARHRHR